MHCNICDKQLGEKEISWNDDLGTYEPCVTCLEVIMEAAYSDGFDTEDDEFIVLESSFDEDTHSFGASQYNLDLGDDYDPYD